MDPINPEIQALREQLAHAEKLAELRRRGYKKAAIGITCVVAALVVASGFFHIVSGSDVTLYPCPKTGWSLSNTFVNADDYSGQSLMMLSQKPVSVAKALFKCGLLDTDRLLRQKAELDDWSRRVDEYRAKNH